MFYARITVRGPVNPTIRECGAALKARVKLFKQMLTKVE